MGVSFGVESGHIFRGNVLGVVDPKGRTSLPAAFRTAAENRARFHMAPGAPTPEREVLIGEHPDLPCLRGYDPTYEVTLLRELKAEIEGSGVANPRAEYEKARRRNFGALETIGYDPSGRIVLPAHLRDYAGLTDTAYFIGVAETFEIWHPATFEEVEADNGPALRKLRALLAERRK